jgi:hypothetical protein
VLSEPGHLWKPGNVGIQELLDGCSRIDLHFFFLIAYYVPENREEFDFDLHRHSIIIALFLNPLSGLGCRPIPEKLILACNCGLKAVRIPLVADAAEEAEASTIRELMQLLSQVHAYLALTVDN